MSRDCKLLYVRVRDLTGFANLQCKRGCCATSTIPISAFAKDASHDLYYWSGAALLAWLFHYGPEASTSNLRTSLRIFDRLQESGKVFAPDVVAATMAVFSIPNNRPAILAHIEGLLDE